MSGEAHCDQMPVSPGHQGEACPLPIDWSRRIKYASLILGAIAGGLALVVFDGVFLPPIFSTDCSRVDSTRAQISTIEKAVTDYKNRHDEYPPSLTALTVSEDGKAASYLEQSDILDDWGAPILYDPQQRDPRTDRPKIFAVTPDGDEIRNWEP